MSPREDIPRTRREAVARLAERYRDWVAEGRSRDDIRRDIDLAFDVPAHLADEYQVNDRAWNRFMGDVIRHAKTLNGPRSNPARSRYVVLDDDGRVLGEGEFETLDEAEDWYFEEHGGRGHLELDDGRRRRRANPSKVKKAARLVVRKERTGSQLIEVVVTGPDKAAEAAVRLIGARAYEVFLIMYLDTRNKVFAYEELTQNSIAEVTVDTASVVRNAVLAGAQGMITAHQHPSGSLEPSDPDRQLWRRLRDQADLMQIRLLDNLVITKDGYFSEGEMAATEWRRAGIDPSVVDEWRKRR